MARKAQAPGYLLERIDDFSGGWNTAHPASIGKNDLAIAKNVLFTPEGKVVPRWGMAKRFAIDFDSNPVLGMGALYKSDGTTRLVIATSGKLYYDLPHILFEYDSQTEWENGTAYNVEMTSAPGSVKLLLPSGPSFSRASSASKLDGRTVGDNQPRYEGEEWVETDAGFALGDLLHVEVSSGLKLALYSAWDETQGKDETFGLDESYAYDLDADASAFWDDWVGTHTTRYQTSGSRVSPPIPICVLGGVTGSAVSWTASTPEGTSLRVYASHTEDGKTWSDWVECTSGEAIPGLSSISDAKAASFRIMEVLETSDDTKTPTLSGLSATWSQLWGEKIQVTGASGSQAAESLAVPASVLAKGRWTIRLLIVPLQVAAGVLWDCYIDDNNYYQLIVDSEGKLCLRVKSVGTLYSTPTKNVGSLARLRAYHVAIRGDGQEITLFVNGTKVASASYVEPVGSLPANMYLGCDHNVSSHVGVMLDDIWISAVARTDGEILADYQAGVPASWDVYTTYLLHFNGDLNLPIERQGCWVSPPQNAAQSEDKSTLRVSWVSAGENAQATLACQVRTSPDGLTWSAWYDQVNGELAGVPPADYSQVRFILQTLDGSSTPELKSCVVSYEGTPHAEQLLSGLSASSHYSFAQLQDYLLVFNGVDLPKKYDGTTIADITAGPRAKYCAVYKERVWAAKGSTLYYSEPFDVDTWPATNFIQINPSDGDEIIALIPAPMMMLIVKQHSTYYLTGYNPQTFAVSPAGDVGTISPRGALWTPYGIFMLDREGVWHTDLRKRALLTRKIEAAWKTLNQRALSKGALFVMNERILVAVPSATANGNDTVLVYDVLHRAWSKVEGWCPSCFLMFWERGRWKYLFGDSRKGQVYEIGGATNDAGTAFEALVETAHLPLMSESWEKRYKWCDLIFTKGSTAQNVAVSFVADGVVGAEKTLNVASGSGTVAGRFWTPPFARTLGVRVRWPATDSGGPELLAVELTYFPRAARPVQVV